MTTGFFLRIVATAEPGRLGEEITVDRTVTIGREPDCDVVLTASSVSRHHARVEQTPDGLRVLDLHSGNGVWVDDARIQAETLAAGRMFVIGGTTFECVAKAAAPAVSAEAPTMVLRSPVAERAPITAMVLRLVEGFADPVGREVTISEGVTTIGRAPDCTIVLVERDISRKHAQIERTAEGYVLTNLGSMCGVFIGVREVTREIVRPGDRFRLGSRVVFECRAETSPALEAATGFIDPAVVAQLIRRAAPQVPTDVPPVPHAAASPSPQAGVESHVASRPGSSAAAEDDATGVVSLETIQRMAKAAASSGAVDASVADSSSGGPSENDATGLVSLDMIEHYMTEHPAGRPAARAAEGAPAVPAEENATRVISRETIERFSADAVAVPAAPAPHAAPDDGAATRLISLETIASMEKNERQSAGVVPAAASAARSAASSQTAVAAPRSIEDAGEAVQTSAHHPFLIDDPESLWYVVQGGLLIFTVALENGEPAGTRTHFMDVAVGEAAFGFDLHRYGVGSGFLAVAKANTTVRKIPMTTLQEIARDPRVAPPVGRLIDAWVSGLCAALVNSLQIKRSGERALRIGERAELDRTTKATLTAGVGWLELASGDIVFNDMATPMFAERGTLFPLTPSSWIRAASDEFGALIIRPTATAAVLGKPTLWHGLDVFHQVVCECEFVNKKLATVDEFVRLQEKERHSDEARESAYGAIGSILSSVGSTPKEFLASGDAEPVMRACELVGRAAGVAVKEPPANDETMPYEQRVATIASVSGFRTRVVALRDRWYVEDNGPLLGQIGASKEPVALLPMGPRAYDCVDPRTGTRTRVTEAIAGTLSSFAYTFYRPFPEGKLGVLDLFRFGSLNLKQDRRWVLILSVIVGMFGTVTPYITGQVFDSAIPQADRSALIGLGVALLFTALATSAFKFTQTMATVRIQTRMTGAIQAAVWDRIMNLPVNFFRKYSAGDLADRAEGVASIQELIAGAGVGAVLGSVSGTFYLVQMFGYNLRLAMLAILLTATFVGFNMTANYLQLKYQRREFQLRGRISGLVLNLLTGVTKLRVCGAEQHAFRVWADQFADQRRISFKVGSIQNTATVFGSVFPVASSILIFLTMMSVQGADATKMSTGDFIAFTTSFGLFLTAMQALGDASLSLLRVVPIYERFVPILEAVPEVDQSKAFPGKLKGSIELSHVYFRYDAEGPWIVQDLSLKIEPGEFVAFVGSSGGGKSTVMRLMLGFEQPTRGAVLYDGQDLNSLDLRMVRQQLGVVLQASRVMPTEMYRNIIGVTSRTIEDAWQAAEKASLAEDIRQMPMGMHTYVSEGGGTLSGGQRQRLMIARAIVNKPKILFLDEATSALDNRAQSVVTESMDKMDSTRIVIAHRLSTVANANRICYLHGGSIAEMGTYQELMDRDGLFAQLAKRQMA